VKEKVYIVEDHEDMRVILKRILLKNISTIQVIGESDTAEKAIQEIPILCPDIVLVDISLPGMDGIELIRIVRSICNSILILVVTAHQIGEYKKEALQAGANDIVSKSDFEMIIDIVRKMANN
jgi:DNA-binding NarL/FixJ family response regulator